MTKYHKNVDWTNDEERLDFEEEIRMWKARRQEWTWCQTLVWILEIFVLNFLVILALYGGKLDARNRYPNTLSEDDLDIGSSFVMIDDR